MATNEAGCRLALSQSAGDYLEEQASEGTFDSTGQFTLDQSKALEKFRRYQFSSPWQYLSFIVQFAVLRQANWVSLADIDWQSNSIEVSCRPLSLQEFEFLVAPPEQCPPDLLRLCMAIEATRRLGPLMIRRIEIVSSDWTLEIGQNGKRKPLKSAADNPRRAKASTGVVFTLVDWVWCGLYLAGRQGWSTSNQFQFCGIPVYTRQECLLASQHLRGATQKQAGHREHHQFNLTAYPDRPEYREVYFASDQWRVDLIPASGHREAAGQSWWVFSAPDQPGRSHTESRPLKMAQIPWLELGQSPAIGCFAYFVKSQAPSQIHWVKFGVIICTTTLNEKEFPVGWSGVVWANDLPTDLSGAKMVDGDAYRQRLHWLQSHLNIS